MFTQGKRGDATPVALCKVDRGLAMATRTTASPPWDRSNPKKKAGRKSRRLTPKQKHEARTRARAAGRPYPNLVDNMAAARKRKTSRAKTRKTRKAATSRTRR